MKIIFDFDNTLFYEGQFVESIRRRFRLCGVTDDLYVKSALEAYEGNVWRPVRHMELIAERCGVPFQQLQRALDAVIANAQDFLYPDVREFLEKARTKHPLSVLTFGDDRFQRMKVSGAGIAGFFQDIVVTRDIEKGKDAVAMANGRPAFFIDDNPRAVEAVKVYAPHITTIRMRRGHGKYIDAPSGKGVDYEVTGLEELYKILNSKF